MALTDLGPTFIKVGQVLAARPDLVGPALGEELKRLRADVPPDDIEKVKATLRRELGLDYEQHFQSIDPVPLATASVGQVHRAVLNDGSRVVIKVLRANIERTMRQDMEVLAGLAQLASHVDTWAVWRPADMVRQLAPMITREMDFSRERQNLEHFAEIFDNEARDVVIPRPVTALCTKRVLVMDELVGQPLMVFLAEIDSPKKKCPPPSPAGVANSEAESPRELSTLDPQVPCEAQLTRAEIKSKLSETLADVYLTMIFDEGLFHADPHPGNLIVMTDGKLGILDFGMIGRIDENLRETIEEMLVAISSGDQHRLMRLIRRIGDAPPTIDDSALAIDVAEFIGTYGRQRLGEFDMTGALNDLSEILHRHAITLPNQSALLLKMLISLEGTLRELGASFDSLEIVRSFVRRAMVRRLSPRRRLRQARRIYLEAENFMEAAPDEVISMLRQARRGELKMQLEHQRIGPTVNRLVLGLMASAVFLGSSLLMAMKVPPLLFRGRAVLGMQDISLLGLVGIVGSMSVMMWLLLAINRTGHLTRGNED